jgi:hypothetical protein
MLMQIKIEPALFYRACDELGIIVIQDMPSLRTRVENPNDTGPCPGQIPVGHVNATEEFSRQLGIMIEQLKSYPSIVTWVSHPSPQRILPLLIPLARSFTTKSGANPGTRTEFGTMSSPIRSANSTPQGSSIP